MTETGREKQIYLLVPQMVSRVGQTEARILDFLGNLPPKYVLFA